jgi:hypothetical protein
MGKANKKKYKVSTKCFPYYKYLLQENYVEYKHIFFFPKCNSTEEVFLETNLNIGKKNMFVFHIVFF